MFQATIIETFPISGRGMVVVFDGFSGLPIGQLLAATVFSQGAEKHFGAWKEWLLRRSETPSEREAFLLVDAKADDTPNGAIVTMRIAS